MPFVSRRWTSYERTARLAADRVVWWDAVAVKSTDMVYDVVV
jgi:hypothetical protein